VTPPVLDDGPHLNYAGQWFIFATLTCIVYPLLVRRTARQRAERAHADGPGPDNGPGPDDGAGPDGDRDPGPTPSEPAALTPDRR
jgi:hypothetical protein